MQLSRQSARLREQSQKLREQDTVIAEMKRHMQEWDLTLSDLKAGRLIPNDNDNLSSAENSSGVSASVDGTNSSNCENKSENIASADETAGVEATADTEGSPSNSANLKRSHSEVASGHDSDFMAIRAKRFCRILKFCENKSMKHTES